MLSNSIVRQNAGAARFCWIREPGKGKTRHSNSPTLRVSKIHRPFRHQDCLVYFVRLSEHSQRSPCFHLKPKEAGSVFFGRSCPVSFNFRGACKPRLACLRESSVFQTASEERCDYAGPPPIESRPASNSVRICSDAACKFSRRCWREDVPGISKMLGER